MIYHKSRCSSSFFVSFEDFVFSDIWHIHSTKQKVLSVSVSLHISILNRWLGDLEIRHLEETSIVCLEAMNEVSSIIVSVFIAMKYWSYELRSFINYCRILFLFYEQVSIPFPTIKQTSSHRSRIRSPFYPHAIYRNKTNSVNELIRFFPRNTSNNRKNNPP